MFKPLFRRAALLVVLALLLAALPAAAQDAPANPLLDLLALVPDTPASLATAITYADYRAFEAARGLDTPTLADFSGTSPLGRQWIAATAGLSAGVELRDLGGLLEGMEQAMGFSWWDIDRALTFGLPPEQGLALAGTFEVASIAAAFGEKGYTTQQIAGDVTLFCGPDGCESGMNANLRARDPGNLFGGFLGRPEPFAVMPGAIANAPFFPVVQGMMDAYAKETPTLADNPYFLAAANAAAASGTVRQVLFLSQDEAAFPPDPQQSFGQLPPYALGFLADTWVEGEQIALVGLVYDDAAAAQAAAAELAARIQVARSLAVEQPFLALIAERGGALPGTSLYTDEAGGKTVALLEIRYPNPDSAEGEAGGPPAYLPSSTVFLLLARAYQNRDLTFLSATAP